MGQQYPSNNYEAEPGLTTADMLVRILAASSPTPTPTPSPQDPVFWDTIRLSTDGTVPNVKWTATAISTGVVHDSTDDTTWEQPGKFLFDNLAGTADFEVAAGGSVLLAAQSDYVMTAVGNASLTATDMNLTATDDYTLTVSGDHIQTNTNLLSTSSQTAFLEATGALTARSLTGLAKLESVNGNFAVLGNAGTVSTDVGTLTLQAATNGFLIAGNNQNVSAASNLTLTASSGNLTMSAVAGSASTTTLSSIVNTVTGSGANITNVATAGTVNDTSLNRTFNVSNDWTATVADDFNVTANRVNLTSAATTTLNAGTDLNLNASSVANLNGQNGVNIGSAASSVQVTANNNFDVSAVDSNYALNGAFSVAADAFVVSTANVANISAGVGGMLLNSSSGGGLVLLSDTTTTINSTNQIDIQSSLLINSTVGTSSIAVAPSNVTVSTGTYNVNAASTVNLTASGGASVDAGAGQLALLSNGLWRSEGAAFSFSNPAGSGLMELTSAPTVTSLLGQAAGSPVGGIFALGVSGTGQQLRLGAVGSSVSLNQRPLVTQYTSVADVFGRNALTTANLSEIVVSISDLRSHRVFERANVGQTTAQPNVTLPSLTANQTSPAALITNAPPSNEVTFGTTESMLEFVSLTGGGFGVRLKATAPVTSLLCYVEAYFTTPSNSDIRVATYMRSVASNTPIGKVVIGTNTLVGTERRSQVTGTFTIDQVSVLAVHAHATAGIAAGVVLSNIRFLITELP